MVMAVPAPRRMEKLLVQAQAVGVELAYLSGRRFDPAELLAGGSIRGPLLDPGIGLRLDTSPALALPVTPKNDGGVGRIQVRRGKILVRVGPGIEGTSGASRRHFASVTASSIASDAPCPEDGDSHQQDRDPRPENLKRQHHRAAQVNVAVDGEGLQAQERAQGQRQSARHPHADECRREQEEKPQDDEGRPGAMGRLGLWGQGRNRGCHGGSDEIPAPEDQDGQAQDEGRVEDPVEERVEIDPRGDGQGVDDLGLGQRRANRPAPLLQARPAAFPNRIWRPACSGLVQRPERGSNRCRHAGCHRSPTARRC